MAEEEVLLSSLLEERLKGRVFDSLHELLVACFYGVFVQANFRCVGLGESGPVSAPSEEEFLPRDWNTNKDVYTFRFTHGASSSTILVKGIPMGNKVLFNVVLSAKPDIVYHLDLNVDDFIRDGAEGDGLSFSHKTRTVKFHNIQMFLTLIQVNLINKLISVFSSTEEEERHERRGGGGGIAPGPSGPYPRPPDFDPLRIGPPRQPFGLGDRDLYPAGVGPNPLPYPHTPFGEGGGNLLGPRHPGFFDPDIGGGYGAGVPGGLPRGAVPPGARFDPFGPGGPTTYPPGRGFGPASGEPDPDHLPPPGPRTRPPGGDGGYFDSMFM